MSAKKVFISYSRKDKAFVERFDVSMRDQGLIVWYDKHIKSGHDWDDVLEKEILQADYMILVLSKTSVKSKNVKDELSFAEQHGVAVHPIRIEECHLPLRMSRMQFVEFSDYDTGISRLLKDLEWEERVVVIDNLVESPKRTVKIQKPKPKKARTTQKRKSKPLTKAKLLTSLIKASKELEVLYLRSSMEAKADTTNEDIKNYIKAHIAPLMPKMGYLNTTLVSIKKALFYSINEGYTHIKLIEHLSGSHVSILEAVEEIQIDRQNNLFSFNNQSKFDRLAKGKFILLFRKVGRNSLFDLKFPSTKKTPTLTKSITECDYTGRYFVRHN